MCNSTAREEYITCYLGNTTAGVRDEQHSCMLPRQWACIYSPHTICSFATQYVENERSSIYVSPCRVCMAYICKWKVHCSLVPEK